MKKGVLLVLLCCCVTGQAWATKGKGPKVQPHAQTQGQVQTQGQDQSQSQGQDQGQAQDQSQQVDVGVNANATTSADNQGVQFQNSSTSRTLVLAPPANGSIQPTAPCYVQQRGFFKRLQSFAVIGMAPVQEADLDCVERENRRVDIEHMLAEAELERAKAERIRAENEYQKEVRK